MTVRELSRAQRRLMDEFARDPDASNDELAARLGCSVSRVEQLFSAVFEVYRVQGRTGALVAHLRRAGRNLPRRSRDTVTQEMGL